MLRLITLIVSFFYVLSQTIPSNPPTPTPSAPSPKPTRSPTYQMSFSCSYRSGGISNSNYGKTNADACTQAIWACPGDTFTVGKCDPSDTNSCYGDQYLVVQASPYGDSNIVAYNDNCKYTIGRNTYESKCAQVTYTVPTTDPCLHYGVVLACGSGTCGGNVPIYMPGNPTLPPTIVPSYAPSRASKMFGFFDSDAPGAEGGIAFGFAMLALFGSVAIFVGCLRFNTSFNHWFWSLEFLPKQFLGHAAPTSMSEPKKSNLEMWGYSHEGKAAI